MNLKWTISKIEDIIIKNNWSIVNKDTLENAIKIKVSYKSEISNKVSNIFLIIKTSTINISNYTGGWKGIKSYNELEKALRNYALLAKVAK